MTYARGSHTFKFGGEIQPVWTNTQVTLFSPWIRDFHPAEFLRLAPFDGTIIPGTGPGTPVAFLFLEPRRCSASRFRLAIPILRPGLYAGPSEQVFNDATSVSYQHFCGRAISRTSGKPGQTSALPLVCTTTLISFLPDPN